MEKWRTNFFVIFRNFSDNWSQMKKFCGEIKINDSCLTKIFTFLIWIFHFNIHSIIYWSIEMARSYVTIILLTLIFYILSNSKPTIAVSVFEKLGRTSEDISGDEVWNSFFFFLFLNQFKIKQITDKKIIQIIILFFCVYSAHCGDSIFAIVNITVETGGVSISMNEPWKEKNDKSSFI